jgi:hypothetical protein
MCRSSSSVDTPSSRIVRAACRVASSGRTDLQRPGLYGDQADLVGDDVVHLSGQPVAFALEYLLLAQRLLGAVGVLQLAQLAAQGLPRAHELAEGGRRGPLQHAVDQVEQRVAVEERLALDRELDDEPDHGDGHRCADHPPALRPAGQRVQRDERGDQRGRCDEPGQRRHEAQPRPPPPHEQAGQCEPARDPGPEAVESTRTR